jgi:hypothetical protein
MKLSYGDVLKELNYAFYVEGKKLTYLSIKNSTDDKIKHNPMFNQIVIIDTNAAHLQSKLKSIDSAETSELINNVNIGLSEMGKNKQTVAFQATYTSETQPLIEKAQQELMQKEEMENQVQQHIKKIHEEIPMIIKEIKEENTK